MCEGEGRERGLWWRNGYRKYHQQGQQWKRYVFINLSDPALSGPDTQGSSAHNYFTNVSVRLVTLDF